MLAILANRVFRHLFAAQLVALFGTGLATIALGLLAYDLSGDEAGMVLGIVFAIKMVAYVGIAPIAGAFANHVPRRAMLAGLDMVRAGVAISLPFVSEIWQIFVLIFVMQAASAVFTPTFQATLPDILPDERDYTRALSLSRFAYDLESLLSPLLAATLLTFVAFKSLFFGTALGFVASGLLIVSILLPKAKQDEKRRSAYDRTTKGIRIYLATPRLRGLLALCLTVSMIGAMVLVNSVVLVRVQLGLEEAFLAYLLGAFGGGSMIAALSLPRLLDHLPDRTLMLAGGILMASALLLLYGLSLAGFFNWSILLGIWCLIGIGYSAVLTPSGRLLQRSSHEEDRPALYAAQFALSHACWLISYPLAGWLQTTFGTTPTLALLGLIGLVSALYAMRLWPKGHRRDLTHNHDDLPDHHPHLTEHGGAKSHSHIYVIDDYHTQWPERA